MTIKFRRITWNNKTTFNFEEKQTSDTFLFYLFFCWWCRSDFGTTTCYSQTLLTVILNQVISATSFDYDHQKNSPFDSQIRRMYHKFVWCHISLGRGWNKELSQWESCVLAVLCINPPAARVKQPDRYGRMYQLYKLLIYFVSAAQIRRSASGYGRKRKKQNKKRKKKSWSLSPGGPTLIRAISARLDISRPVYTWRPLHIYWAGWAAGLVYHSKCLSAHR